MEIKRRVCGGLTAAMIIALATFDFMNVKAATGGSFIRVLLNMHTDILFYEAIVLFIVGAFIAPYVWNLLEKN
jgi:hypothetical protein